MLPNGNYRCIWLPFLPPAWEALGLRAMTETNGLLGATFPGPTPQDAYSNFIGLGKIRWWQVTSPPSPDVKRRVWEQVQKAEAWLAKRQDNSQTEGE